MRHWRLAAAIAVIALCATVAYAQKSGLSTDTQHGAVGTTPCGSCHVPHGGTNADIILWDQSLPPTTTTYTVYTSPTIDNATTDIVGPGDGGATQGDPENQTLLCMSCHDGAVAATNSVTLTTTEYGSSGGAITGTAIDIGGSGDLSDDHPVNMSLDPANDAGLDTVTNVEAAGLVLYSGGGATNTVQCGSCHDPHNNTNQDYLRIDNSSSGLCLACHL